MKENTKRGPGRPRKDSHNYTPHEGVRIEIKETKTEPKKRGRKTSITEIERELIGKLYKNKMQLSLISKYTGHSKTTILKIIDELGIARRNQQTSN